MSTLHSNTTASHLPWEEAMLLINHLYDDGEYRMSLLISCGCFLGLKISELLSLTWNDLLQEETIPTCTPAPVIKRMVLIDKSFKRHIRKCHDALDVKDCSEHCFLNRYGNIISRQMINRKLKWYKTKYRLPISNFSTHSFRKTWARKIYDTEFEKGRGEMALLRLAESMNHSSPAVTWRYIGLEEDSLENLISGLKF